MTSFEFTDGTGLRRDRGTWSMRTVPAPGPLALLVAGALVRLVLRPR